MPGIVQITRLEEKLSYRSKLKDTGTRRVACIPYFTTAEAQANAGTIDYPTDAFTFRTKDFNGYLIPEKSEGDFLSMPTNGNNIMIGNGSSISASVNQTGAKDAIVKRRLLFPFILPAGRVVGNFRLWVPSTVVTSISSGNGFHMDSGIAGSTGLAGTMTITAALGRLSSAGALTQIGSTTDSFTMVATNNAMRAVAAADPTTGVTADLDMLYLELQVRVNQSARTTGSGGTFSPTARLSGGYVAHTSNPNLVLNFEFDIA